MIQPRRASRGGEEHDHFQVQIYLEDIEPRIWRRILLPKKMTLHELHRIIQLSFDWYDYHLYSFRIGEDNYEAPDEEAEGLDSTKARLDRLGLGPGDKLEYVYDWGDEWRHIVEFEEPEGEPDLDWLPTVAGGARRAPPEDCGGPNGYSEILDALRKPFEDLEEWEQERIEWLGPDFDPDEFSLAQARHALLLVSAWGTLKRKQR